MGRQRKLAPSVAPPAARDGRAYCAWCGDPIPAERAHLPTCRAWCAAALNSDAKRRAREAGEPLPQPKRPRRGAVVVRPQDGARCPVCGQRGECAVCPPLLAAAQAASAGAALRCDQCRRRPVTAGGRRCGECLAANNAAARRRRAERRARVRALEAASAARVMT